MTRARPLSSALLDGDFSFDGINLVEASAGTGKTYSIQSLYLRLVLERGLACDEICVVTFTDAATRELADRIRSILRQARSHLEGRLDADAADGERIEAFVAMLREKEPGRWKELARHRLDEVLGRFDDAAIFTIHGFCNRILSEWAFECGELFDRELTAETETLVEELVHDHFRKHVAHGDDIAVALAEAAGLTLPALLSLGRTLSRRHDARVVPALESEITEAEVHDGYEKLLAIAAARPRLEEEWLDATAKRYLVKPFYGAIPQHLEALKAKGRKDGAGVARVVAALAHFTRENFDGGLAVKGKKSWSPSPELEAFVDACSDFTRMLKTWGLAEGIRFVETFRKDFARLKEERRLLTYDDMLLRVQKALERPEAGELLLARLRRRYRVGIVDEFQDTDSVQWEVFSRIFADDLPLFLVGDPKQAIYSFRSGDIYTYLDAAEHAKNRFTLDKNYRSEGTLVAAVNDFFSPRGPMSTFLVEEIEFLEQEANDLPPGKELSIRGAPDPRPMKIHFLEGREGKSIPKGEARPLVAAHVADEIARLLADPDLAVHGRPLRPSDVCVLTTTHRQSRLVQQELATRKIPVVLQSSGNVFYGTDFVFGSTQRTLHGETRALLLLLHALAEPRSDRAIRAVLASPLFPHRADEIHAMFVDEEAWQARDHVLAVFSRAHDCCTKRSFVTAFEFLDHAFDLRAYLLGRPGGERLVTNLLQQVELVDGKMRQERLGLNAITSWIEGLEARGEDAPDEQAMRLETDAKAVQVMTVFKSKGLEFPVVFAPYIWDRNPRPRKGTLVYHRPEDGRNRLLIDLDHEGLLSPDDLDERRHDMADEALAEDVRLLYVALTRAAHQVHLYLGHINETARTGLSAVIASERLHAVEGTDGSVFARLPKAHASSLSENRDWFESSPHMEFGPLDPPRSLRCYENRGESLAPEKLRWRCWPDDRSIDVGWQIRSFTALSRHEDTRARPRPLSVPEFLEEGIDIDQSDALRGEETRPPLDLPEPDEMQKVLMDFPAGARTGTAWHGLFEVTDFAADLEEIRRNVVDKLDGYRLVANEKLAPLKRAKQIDAVTTMVDRVLTTPLSSAADAPCLKAISRQDRIAEMPFDFVLRPGATLAGLDRCLCETWPDWRDLGRNYRNDGEIIGSGLMTGFIDLVFRCPGPHGPRYALLDWKSNRIGTTRHDFAPDAIRDEIIRSGYALQYLLYTLALDGQLKRCLSDYDYERHFAGVYYVFLRGVDGRAGRSVHFDRPPAEAIEAAGTLLMGAARG